MILKVYFLHLLQVYLFYYYQLKHQQILVTYVFRFLQLFLVHLILIIFLICYFCL